MATRQRRLPRGAKSSAPFQSNCTPSHAPVKVPPRSALTRIEWSAIIGRRRDRGEGWEAARAAMAAAGCALGLGRPEPTTRSVSPSGRRPSRPRPSAGAYHTTPSSRTPEDRYRQGQDPLGQRTDHCHQPSQHSHPSVASSASSVRATFPLQPCPAPGRQRPSLGALPDTTTRPTPHHVSRTALNT